MEKLTSTHIDNSASYIHNHRVSPKRQAGMEPEPVFERVLQDLRQKPLIFSSHALQRMESRRIQLEGDDLQKISAAVEKAEAKGARSSLLLYRDLALVASISKRTVITAVDGIRQREHIFTNIDSTVIIE